MNDFAPKSVLLWSPQACVVKKPRPNFCIAGQASTSTSRVMSARSTTPLSAAASVTMYRSASPGRIRPRRWKAAGPGTRSCASDMRALLMNLLQRRLPACDDVLRDRLEDHRPPVLLARRQRPRDEGLQQVRLLGLGPEDHVRVRADRVRLREARAPRWVHDRELVRLRVELPVCLRGRLDPREPRSRELLRPVLHGEELQVVL